MAKYTIVFHFTILQYLKKDKQIVNNKLWTINILNTN